MHHRRKKSKRQVRCTLCTPYKWRGNDGDRTKAKDNPEQQEKATPSAAEKKRKEKPFRLMRKKRYEGYKRETWIRRLYGRGWHTYGRYKTRERAEQAAEHYGHTWQGRDCDFRIDGPDE